MEELRSKAAELATIWKELLDDHLNEQICRAHIPGITLPQLNEVVGIVCESFNRINAPQGFAPTYKLARALAAGGLQSALGSAKQIHAGTLTHLPSFVAYINQTLSAFHSLLVYGDKHDFAADMAMQQQESLRLLDTAQKELTLKLEQLKAAAESEEKLEKCP